MGEKDTEGGGTPVCIVVRLTLGYRKVLNH